MGGIESKPGVVDKIETSIKGVDLNPTYEELERMIPKFSGEQRAAIEGVLIVNAEQEALKHDEMAAKTINKYEHFSFKARERKMELTRKLGKLNQEVTALNLTPRNPNGGMLKKELELVHNELDAIDGTMDSFEAVTIELPEFIVEGNKIVEKPGSKRLVRVVEHTIELRDKKAQAWGKYRDAFLKR